MRRPITSNALTIATAAILLLSGLVSFGQDKPKKIKPRMRMAYYHYSDTGPEIHVNAYYKPEDGGTAACTGAVLSLMNSKEEVFAEMTVGEEAITIFSLGEEHLAFFEDTTNFYYFLVEMEGGEKFRDRDADLEIWASRLETAFEIEDSVKTIRAVFSGADDSGRLVPVEDALLKFYVKRLLYPLPVGGGDPSYTDSRGRAEIEFPDDLPGDEEGNLTILVKLEEDDRYGTVVLRETLAWGIRRPVEHHVNGRSLISPGNNAPWFMVIGINSSVIAVWGVMLWVVFNLFRIRKFGKKIAS
jgi:hypothetical protein